MVTVDQLAGMAVAREAKPPTRPPDVQRTVDTVVKKVDDGKWREGLQQVRMGSDTGQKIAAKNEEIGVTYDTKGKKDRSTAERTRFKEANKWAAHDEKFLRVGYDGMDSTPGGEQDQLRANVLAEASLFPVIKEQLGYMNPDEQKNFAERILREGKLSLHGKELIDGLLHPENQLIKDGVILNAQDAVTVAESKAGNKDADFRDVDRRITAINRQLKDFERPGGAGTMGTSAAKMEAIRAGMPTTKAELDSFKAEAETQNQKLAELRRERQFTITHGTTKRTLTDVDSDIAATETAYKKANEEVAKREATIQELKDLELREQQLEEQKKQAGKDHRDAKLEKDTADLEVSQRQRELDDLKRVREAQENDLVNSYKNLIKDAAAATFQEDLDTYMKSMGDEVETLKLQSANGHEKVMYDSFMDAWHGPERTRRVGLLWRREERYRPISREHVNDYHSMLMDPTQGPEGVMRSLLTGKINPETGAAYTTPEIDTLMRNKEFIDNVQPEVTKQLLARKIMVGGLTKEDIYMVTHSPWGMGMIEGAMEKNKAFRDNVEAALGAGALSKDFRARFAEAVKKHPLWLLLLLGGLGSMFTVSAVRSASEQSQLSA